MREDKNNNIITFILITIITAIIMVISAFGYYIYTYINNEDSKVSTQPEIEDIMNKAENKIEEIENTINSSLGAKNPYEDIPETSAANTQTIASENRYYYNQLDQYAKIIYEGLENNIDNLKSGTYTINYSTKFNNLLNQENGQEQLNKSYQSAWDAFSFDKPSMFYIDSTKVYMTIESTTIGNKTTYNVKVGKGSNDNYFAKGFETEQQVQQAISQVEEIKNNILSETSGSNYQKIVQVHNWLVDNLQYESSVSKNNIYNIYGAFINKEVVCEGYARSFKYMLDQLQIPCIIVTGTGVDSNGQNQRHAWNYVLLNENWYAVDVTWDDPIIRGFGKITDDIKYKYLCKGSTIFDKDHKTEGKISDNGMVFTYPILSQNNYK